MQIVIEIPKEFEEHFKKDRFEDSLQRLSADANCLAGNYEQETAIMLINALKNGTPPVEERKKGKWIYQKDGGCCCSECGEYALDKPDRNFIHVSVKSNFCPYCGADMRGETE